MHSTGTYHLTVTIRLDAAEEFRMAGPEYLNSRSKPQEDRRAQIGHVTVILKDEGMDVTLQGRRIKVDGTMGYTNLRFFRRDLTDLPKHIEARVLEHLRGLVEEVTSIDEEELS